jgi:site-specific recombinase XerD
LEELHKTSLPSFVKDYLASLFNKQRKASTIKRYIYDLEDFFVWLQIEKGDRSFATWSKLAPVDIQTYLSILTHHRKYQPRTTKRVLTVLNQLYKYYDNLGLSQNPILEINKIDIKEPTMTNLDFLTEKEIQQLFSSLRSDHDLSENQLKTRHLIVDRNEAIFILFLFYGLSLQELTNLNMNGIHFETNTITVASTEHQRTIKLSLDHKHVLYKYYDTIPIPVRPRYHENDPFFVAFDFQRGTYRWVYDGNKPKKLTDIAIQRMIQKEIKRGNLRKGISAQHLRNTYILTEILNGKNISIVQRQLGLKTAISLKKYFNFVNGEI